MPPRGGEATDERRLAEQDARPQAATSAADELLSTEWHALMAAALDDLASITGPISRTPRGTRIW